MSTHTHTHTQRYVYVCMYVYIIFVVHSAESLPKGSTREQAYDPFSVS